MEESNLYIDKITKKKLLKIAKRNNMSAVAQIRFWVRKEVSE
jgi:hypothetical protein